CTPALQSTTSPYTTLFRSLDSYDAERVPVARRLLDTTDRAFRLVVSDNPLAGLFRTQILARIMAFGMRRKWVQRRAFRIVSQTRSEEHTSELQSLAYLVCR